MDVKIVDLLILTLAVWRVSSLLVDESGTLDVFEQLRTWMGVRYQASETGEMEQFVPSDTPRVRAIVANWLTCKWCISLWVGMILAGIYLVWPNIVLVVLPWALSAGTVMIDSVIGRRYRRRVYIR